MSTLVVGFDSAWSANNSGAIASVLIDGGKAKEEFLLQPACFQHATDAIKQLQKLHRPTSTIIMIDQPIIVINKTGQRSVENIVSSIVGKRKGGMQPANTGKSAMFGDAAPVWAFLEAFKVNLTVPNSRDLAVTTRALPELDFRTEIISS